MKFIQHAMGALVLACLAGTASATMVEVNFVVHATSKVTTTFLNGAPAISVTDPTFQPISFNATFRFDLENPLSQELNQAADDVTRARTDFAPATSSFTATPFSASVMAPAPVDVMLEEQATASYSQHQLAIPNGADQVIPVSKQAHFNAEIFWYAQDIDGAGTSTTQLYSRNIFLEASGSPLSSKQFSKLSGEDALAFIQSQVGTLHRQAFNEYSWRLVESEFGASTKSYSVGYQGDVTISSVSVVPEPGVLLLSLLGVAVVALHAGRARR